MDRWRPRKPPQFMTERREIPRILEAEIKKKYLVEDKPLLLPFFLPIFTALVRITTLIKKQETMSSNFIILVGRVTITYHTLELDI